MREIVKVKEGLNGKEQKKEGRKIIEEENTRILIRE